MTTSTILNMYLPIANEKKMDMTTKSNSSIEYHTSIIQSIESVKRPFLFHQYDNDTSSRYFSSSPSTNSSVFDAIQENQHLTSNRETISSSINNNKRFKKIDTDNNNDLLLQSTTHSSIDKFITPTKQNRNVLKRQSLNIDQQSDMKIFEQESNDIQV